MVSFFFFFDENGLVSWFDNKELSSETMSYIKTLSRKKTMLFTHNFLIKNLFENIYEICQLIDISLFSEYLKKKFKWLHSLTYLEGVPNWFDRPRWVAKLIKMKAKKNWSDNSNKIKEQN